MATRTKRREKAPAEGVERVRPADLHPAVQVLLTRKDVCAALRVSERTLTDMIHDTAHPFPRGRQIGSLRQPRWLVSDLNGWIDSKAGRVAEGGEG